MKKNRLAALGAMAAFLPGSTAVEGAGKGAPPQLTTIDDVVMYGIDADTSELLRYTFDTDEYVIIGVVEEANGNVVADLEGLAFIPHGPHKGMYGTANYDENRPTKLVKISALDATAWVYEADLGFEKGEGLVAVQDPDTYEWSLLGVTKHAGAGDRDHSLISIDPATGVGTLVMSTSERYVGLAQGPDGIVYTTDTDSNLWTIDVAAGTETLIGTVGDDEIEALEHAFGNVEPRIKVPLVGANVVPDSWTKDGILFGFSDDVLMIINPSNGAAVEWDCSLASGFDCEGLVFTTRQRDPFGPIVASAGD